MAIDSLTVLALFPFFNAKIVIQTGGEKTARGNINFRTIEKLLLLIYQKGQTSLSSNHVSQPIRVLKVNFVSQNQHFQNDIQ